MMYNRLVTFGCSLTYGQALHDRHKESWPAQLGKLLNLPFINQGRAGASAKRIWWEILHFPFQDNDLVCIGWTHKDRWCIIKKPHSNPIDNDLTGDGNDEITNFDLPELALAEKYEQATGITDINLGREEIADVFYRHIHNDFDMTVNYFTFVNHIKYFLDDKKITNYHLDMTSHDSIPKFNKVQFLPISFDDIRKANPKAKDNWHPGVQAYKQFSSAIYNHIKEMHIE